MDKKRVVDIFIVGFALFAMFFGAGNLIFPPILGLESGASWMASISGFAITSVFATFLGIMTVVVSGDNFSDVGNRIHPIFSVVIASICMLSIGPLIAIPRTAATTFEVGVQSIFPETKPLVSSIVFFTLTFILSLSSSKVVNIIGKFLTPVLLTILVILIISGIISPIDPNLNLELTNTEAFVLGFREGYQTMDLLASFIMAGIIIAAIKGKGYTEEKEKKKTTILSALIAMTFLLLIYGGLVYLGATSGYTTDDHVSRTELLLHISNGILGPNGTIFLALCVGLACLTTSIALTSAVSDYFSKLSNQILSYRLLVAIVCVISGYLSVHGVETIINVAFPFLAVIYPIVVCMAVYIVFFGKFVPHKSPYVAAISITFVIAVIGLLGNLGIAETTMNQILNSIPLNKYEIPWLLPSFIGFVLLAVIANKKGSQTI